MNHPHRQQANRLANAGGGFEVPNISCVGYNRHETDGFFVWSEADQPDQGLGLGPARVWGNSLNTDRLTMHNRIRSTRDSLPPAPGPAPWLRLDVRLSNDDSIQPDLIGQPGALCRYPGTRFPCEVYMGVFAGGLP